MPCVRATSNWLGSLLQSEDLGGYWIRVQPLNPDSPLAPAMITQDARARAPLDKQGSTGLCDETPLTAT
jgi:hypothetical protein